MKLNNSNPIEQNTTAFAHQNLRQLIIKKKIPPGSKINQNQLAEELQISRTPLVKALHKLETEGLVDNIPQRGFYVHQLTIKELVDLFALREAIDGIIVPELIETITAEQIKQLKDNFQEFRENPGPVDRNRYWYADMSFHNQLVYFSKNVLAKKINENFQIYNRTFIAGLLREPTETLPEHLAVIEAIESKNPEAAKMAAVRHVNLTKNLLQEVVLKLRKLGVDSDKIFINDLSKINES